MNSGPILLIEDDIDDKDILEIIFKELDFPNRLVWFTNCKEALHYLKTTSDPLFLIICDVNLPGTNGIEFKKNLDADKQLREKSIPFIFYSTSVDRRAVQEAYTESTVQGFFKKDSNFEDIKTTMKLIHAYWRICQHPNSL